MPPPAVSSPHRVTVSLLFCQQQALSRNPMNLPERVCCCLFFLSSGRHHLTVYPGNLSYPRASLHNTSHSLSLIHISEPTRRTPISYAVFCLKKKKNTLNTCIIKIT